jgi:hypothetical protein
VSDAGAPGRSFGYWLTIVANLAVVGGIIFLGVEIRQNSVMIEAQIMQSRTEAAMAEQANLFNSEFMPAIILKVKNDEELTPEEMGRYGPWVRGLNRNLDNQLWQWRRGLLDDNIPRSVRGAVLANIGVSPVAITTWDRQKASYTDEYLAFVEEAIADLRSQER